MPLLLSNLRSDNKRSLGDYDVDELERLVAEDRLENALDVLERILNVTKSTVPHDVILLRQRLQGTSAQRRAGTITREEAQSERTAIAKSFLELLQEICRAPAQRPKHEELSADETRARKNYLKVIPGQTLRKLLAKGSPRQRKFAVIVLIFLFLLSILDGLYNVIDTVAYIKKISYFVKLLGVISEEVRFVLLLFALLALCIFIFLAARATTQKNTLIYASLAGIPLIFIMLVFVTFKSHAEVSPKNIAMVTNDGAHRDPLRLPSGEVDALSAQDLLIHRYDLSSKGFDPVRFKTFLEDNHVKYVVISSQMSVSDFNAFHRIILPRGLTIITTPDANGDNSARTSLGIYVSPEFEAERIQSDLAKSEQSFVLLLYNDPPGDAETFDTRFKAQLARSRVLDVHEWPIERLNAQDPLLLDHIARGATIVVSDTGPTSMSTITAIRHLNPSARIISTSRTLDYADFELLQRLRIETPLPWRIAHALSRKLTSGDQPASPPPRPVQTATVNAVRLSAVLESRHGGLRLSQLRNAIFGPSGQWPEELEREYGSLSFADGPLPHLRISALTLLPFVRPDTSRKRP